MENHSDISEAVTGLILEVFRFNGALLNAGDNLVRDLGLTSARWQVLGAVVLEERDLSVAQIARRMGLARQSVQRVVNDLVESGLLRYEENPDHKRAKLVALTDKGAETYRLADQRQIRWAKSLADGITVADLEKSLAIIRCLEERCTENAGQDNGEQMP